MSIVLTAGHPFSELENMRTLLAIADFGTGLAVLPGDLSEEGSLRTQLAAGARIVLVYVEPSVSLGRMLRGVEASPQAVAGLLADWRVAGRAMLSLTARYPDRCLLVHADAALASPSVLFGKVQEVFQLALDAAASNSVPLTLPAMSPLESLLADALVSADREAASLFVELESCAHIGRGEMPNSEQRAQAAWTELQTQLSRIALLSVELQQAQEALGANSAQLSAMASGQLVELEERINTLVRERDSHANVATSATEALEAKNSELGRQNRLVQHLQNEGESLILTLHKAHLESEELFKRTESLGSELEVSRANVAAVQHELALAQSALLETRQSSAATKLQLLVHITALQDSQDRLAKLGAEHDETRHRLADLQTESEGHKHTKQERDQTRLQLMQVNSEVARLLDRSERDASLLAQTVAARQLLQSFWRTQQPDEVRIDMRREIVGDNWYAAEDDGRWTGPGRQSTLTLPALKPGHYSLQVTLVGAMSPHIAAGLQFELNGRPLDVAFNRAKHPRVGEVKFVAPSTIDSVWVLGLAVPAVISPGDRGGADQRKLGVRVAEIKFIALSGS